MTGISTAYTLFVILQYDYAPIDPESLLAQVFETTEPITHPISRTMPIVLIYSSKLSDMGYAHLIPVLENIYAINLVLLFIFIAFSLKHLDRLKTFVRNDISVNGLPKLQAEKKIALSKNVSIAIFLIAGFFFFCGDPLMEYRSAFADNIHLSKWNFLRAPLWMGFFYFFLMYYLALMRKTQSAE